MIQFSANIDLNLYKTFYAVVEYRSFSKAAEEIYISQPAISRNIKVLEKNLNVQLFYRNSKGVTVTPEGERLYYYIKNAYDSIYLGERSIKESKKMISGNIRIGVPTYIANSYLVDKIEKFHNKYPNIKFHIQDRSTIDMVYMLEKHQLDFIIDSFPIEKNSLDLLTRKIISLDIIFVGETNFIQKYDSKTIDIDEINDIPLILPNKNTSSRKKLDQAFEKYKIKLDPVMEISTTEMTLKMIRKNIGVSWLIEDTVKEKLKKNRMKKLDINIELPKMDIGIAYVNNFLTYAPKRFIEEELLKQ